MQHLFYVIVFLLLLLTLNVLITPIAVKETFAVQDFPLDLNILKRQGRNLQFPYFGSKNTFTASQRASFDPTVSSTKYGLCVSADNTYAPSLDDTWSILYENGVYYKLKKSCFALAIRSYSFTNRNTLVVTFNMDTPENVENVVRFFLLNPLFVEFNIGTFSSVAYTVRPPYSEKDTFFITNVMDPKALISGIGWPINKKIDVTFDMVPFNSPCDNAFNYANYKQSARPVTTSLLNSIKDNSLNLSVHYTDDLRGSFQSVGLQYPIIPLSTNKMTVFDINYERFASDNLRLGAYEFMKNIAVMFNNNVTPVLTFSFDISINKNMSNALLMPNTVLKFYMENGWNQGSRLADCVSNMLAVTVQAAPDCFYMLLSTGNNNDCGFSSTPAFVVLPFVTPNTIFSVTMTVTPNQKIIYAEWSDVNAGDAGKKISYTKTDTRFAGPDADVCATIDSQLINNTNNMTRMFTSKSTTQSKRIANLANITMEWNPSYVSTINELRLGHANYYNRYMSS